VSSEDPVPSPIFDLIRCVAGDPAADCPDRELLARFLRESPPRNADAFGALLRRHGAMILDVCRGVLGNRADAEDAFQATFLVLAQKAATISETGSLAAWLHGVAHRIALKARAAAVRRSEVESQVPLREVAGPDDLTWAEVRRVLHEELAALPEKLRAPLVLCYLEAMTQDRAAAELGVSKETLKRRLDRGRALLRARLTRRGFGPVAVLALSAWPAEACVPQALIDSMNRAAAVVAAGGGVGSILPAGVAVLTQGALKTMVQTKLIIAASMLLMVGAIGLGVDSLIDRKQAAPVPESTRAGLPDGANLRAGEPDQPGKKTDEQPNAKPTKKTDEQPDAKPTKITWGKEVNGLQVGIWVRDDKQTYRIGEEVPLQVNVRNVGKETVRITANAAVPEIEDSAGKTIPKSYFGDNRLVMPPAVRYVIPVIPQVVVSLKPGEEKTVGLVQLKLAPTTADGPVRTPELRAAPGDYSIRFAVVLGTDLSLSTGQLKLVVQPAKSGE
jgi:RNA polymerase sigma factor (sigma-70 family)